MKNFHRETVKNFVPVNGFVNFDYFRKTVIQKIYWELPYFFEEQECEFILINLLNACFNIFNQQVFEKARVNQKFEKSEFFELLFYTSCYIVVKLQKPEQLPNLKEILIEQKNVDFSLIIELEQTMLHTVKWKINLQTPYQMLICIFKELYPQMNFSSINVEDCEGIYFNKFQMTLNLIKYCINEFSIYKKYNEYIITISCILHTFKFNDEILEMQILKRSFEEDSNLIDQCLIDIDSEFNKQEDSEIDCKGFIDPSYSLYVDHYFCEDDIKAILSQVHLNDSNNKINHDVKSNQIIQKTKLTLLNENTTDNFINIKVSKENEEQENNNISDINKSQNPLLFSSINPFNVNDSFSSINFKTKDEGKNFGSSDMTPTRNSILSPGRLIFSNIQRLNFETSGNQDSGVKFKNKINKSDFKNISESIISSTTADQITIDYECLPKQNLFSNSNYNSYFFEENILFNKNKFSSSDFIEKVDNDSVYSLEKNNHNENTKKSEISTENEKHQEKNKKNDLLKVKRKKSSNRNIFSLVNKNKQKITQENKESKLEEEKENDFSSANKMKINILSQDETSFCDFRYENVSIDYEPAKRKRIRKVKVNNKKLTNKHTSGVNLDIGKNDKVTI